MTAIEGFEVLMVGLCTVLVALGLAASLLRVLLVRVLERNHPVLTVSAVSSTAS